MYEEKNQGKHIYMDVNDMPTIFKSTNIMVWCHANVKVDNTKDKTCKRLKQTFLIW